MSFQQIGEFEQQEQSNIILHPLAMVRRGRDMQSANLSGGDFRKIDFFQSNMQMANAARADFRGAQLVECDLRGADLMGANLRNADLCRTMMREANLVGADMRGARMWASDLRGADCTGLDLRGADVRQILLDDAKIDGIKLSPYKIVPEEGAFVGWQTWGGYLLRFLIPDQAKRTNSVGSRICRADRVHILGCWDRNRAAVAPEKFITVGNLDICVDREFQLVGHDYNDDIGLSVGGGICFYLSYEEAATDLERRGD